MNREEALGSLPDAHRHLLEWLAEGEDHEAIAGRLDIEPAALPSLVMIAERKLQRLITEDPGV
jgi:hypothetical protein